MSEQREAACAELLRQARTIVDAEGTGEPALNKIKTLLVSLADQGETLFPRADFAMPDAQGRNHILAVVGSAPDYSALIAVDRLLHHEVTVTYADVSHF